MILLLLLNNYSRYINMALLKIRKKNTLKYYIV